MPTAEKVTEVMRERSKDIIRTLYERLTWLPLQELLVLFMIELYEVALIVNTEIGDRPLDKFVNNIYKNGTVKSLMRARNTLSHNLYSVTSVYAYVEALLYSVDQVEFKQICTSCGLPDDTLLSLLDICSKDETVVNDRINSLPTLTKHKIMSQITGE